MKPLSVMNSFVPAVMICLQTASKIKEVVIGGTPNVTKRLSLTRNGQVRYELKTPRRNGTLM